MVAQMGRASHMDLAPARALSRLLCTGCELLEPVIPRPSREAQRFCKSVLTVRRKRTYIRPSTAGLLGQLRQVVFLSFLGLLPPDREIGEAGSTAKGCEPLALNAAV